MKRVFADTGYWVALLNPSDDLNAKAKEVSRRLGAVRIYTTEMVLVEVANMFGKEGETFRALERFNKNCSHLAEGLVIFGHANNLTGSSGTHPGFLR
jgi:predicted nucleic acid-binding protein